MALIFPNPSRSCEADGKHIHFFGYEGDFEILFIVETNAISLGSSKGENTEADYLAAFDKSRDTILKVARKAYSKSRKNVIHLTSSEFR